MRYAKIDSCEYVNGNGIGVALFVQGCRAHCKNCFNPETWGFHDGKEWTEEVKDELLKLIDRPYISRVSILGGEPLEPENLDDVYDLLVEIRQRFPDKMIWLYTGRTIERILNLVLADYFDPVRYAQSKKRQEIVKLCDVIVDGRYIDGLADVTYPWAGSTNQRVISVKESLQQDKVVLYETNK